MNISELLGKTISKIDINDERDRIGFTLDTGKKYVMYHSQSCCESVSIEDISGDINDLIGSPLTMAEETSNSEGVSKSEWHDSWTWTFYKLATVNGYVTIRWYGQSSGYYSESVDFEEMVA